MKILVRNLARSITEKELFELFEPFGKIDSCIIVKDQSTNKSKGFGFVEMPHAREAVKAIKSLNTLKVQGVGIRVKQAED